MKKTFLFFAVIMLLVFSAGAQFQSLPVTKKSGTSQTQTTVQRQCGTMQHLEWMKQQDPTLEARMQAEEQKFNEYVETHQEEILNNKTTYTMPVVVHVVYKNTSTGYVTAARVQEQIDQTNSDWAGTNGRSMEQFASSLRADCGITLCLATKDPNGNATTGIDYVQTTVTSFSYDDKVKSSSTGGANAWDPTKYLNIWVCNLGGGLCGYAQFPSSGINSTYGVVIHYQYFGHTGASSPYNWGGTTSHEFGHCFNLYHIWGDDGGSCSGTDYCNDTPNQASENYGNQSGCVTDNCTTSCPGIMYMNFMDYSDDLDYANMTPNQATRMQSAISSYLSGVAANAATACSTGPAAPVANFTASATTINPGGNVNFSDLSSNSPTSWSWTFGDGGTSTSQNPSHTYSAVGSYTVSLTATNSYGSDSETKTGYITVTTGGTSTCDTSMAASFTSGSCDLLMYYADATPYDSGFISGQNAYLDKEKAMLYTGVSGAVVDDVFVLYGYKAGSSGNTSVKIYSSASGAPGSVLGTSASIAKSAIDTTSQGINFSNKYHFSSPVSASSDFFASVVLPTTFTSGSDELVIWCSDYTCSSTSALAYEMWSDNGWYSFLDVYSVNVDMAIFPEICTAGDAGLIPMFAENIYIFPNPSQNDFNVLFVGNQQKDILISVFNSVGEKVKELTHSDLTDKLTLEMAGLADGIYNVKIQTSEGSTVKKVILMK